MLLTLALVVAVLILMEELFSRGLRQGWRAMRWLVLPAGGISIASWFPAGLFGHPAVMDLVASVLLGLAVATLVALHGTFRDGHWREQTPVRDRRAVAHPHPPRFHRQPTTTTGAARAPLRSRP